MKKNKKYKPFNFQYCINKHVNWKTSNYPLKAQVSSAASYNDKEGDESNEDDDYGDKNDDNDDDDDDEDNGCGGGGGGKKRVFQNCR